MISLHNSSKQLNKENKVIYSGKTYLNRLLSALIVCSFLLCSLVGCGKTETVETIVLKEPKNVAINYAIAENRDLYDYTIFSSVVSPYVEEYSFTKNQVFDSYEFTPGDSVNRGDVLVTARTQDSIDAIKNLDETIEELGLSHTVETEHFKTDLDMAYKNESNSNGNENAKLSRERLEESQKESNERYFLELEHLKEKRKLLVNESNGANIRSNVEGEVVNCAFIYGADEIQKDLPIIAVGDLSQKLLKCEYITKGTINKADEFFALINGKKYNLINESIDSDEAAILKNAGETVYSTFAIDDANDEVNYGDFAAIVLVRDSRKNVLCVPKDSVKSENGISYVYITDGSTNKYTEIETGMKDDFFVEVLSGVNPGDKVLTSDPVKKDDKTATLSKGECSQIVDISGVLYYPFSRWIVSPIEDANAYIKEIKVEEFQEVKAGETILTIEAVTDDIEIERLSNKITRIENRIAVEVNRQAEIDKKNLEIDDPDRKLEDRSIEKNLVSYQKDLILAKNQLQKLKKYSGIINITAPSDGIITDIGTLKEGDLIYPDTKIMQFSDISKSFIILKDDSGVLNYGQSVTIDYADTTGNRVNLNGRVVTVNNTSLSSKMQSQWALVAINEEDKVNLSGSGVSDTGMWYRNMYKCTINTRQMKDVLLVPKSAVELKGGKTYVKVINSDGSVSLKGFISGGSNNDYYFVVQGLSEGTNICYK